MRGRPDTSLAAELFCWPSDPTWTAPDAAIVSKTLDELQALDLLRREQVTHSAVVRIPNAYPVFDREFDARLRTIQGGLAAWPGLHVMGRTGAFQYLDQAGCVRRAFDWTREHLGAGA
jgi:protoporphyrinogen oxidase